MNPSKKSGLLYSNEYMNHVTPPGHPESTHRLEITMRGLKESGLVERTESIAARLATREEVLRSHAAKYFETAKSDAEHGLPMLSTGDTNITERSFDVALLAAGGGCSPQRNPFTIFFRPTPSAP